MGFVRLVVIALLLCLPAAAAAVAQADTTKEDVVYLKGGGTVRGIIVPDLSNNAILVIRTKDGKDIRVMRDQIVRVVRESPVVAAPAVVQRRSRKEPAIAWFLSFLIPGAGQYYNGEFVKGVGFMAAQIVTAGIYLGKKDDCDLYDADCSTVAVALGLGLANWVAAMIDAPVSAKAINRRRGLALEVGPQPHPLGMSLVALRF